jgi:hypothetical protein
VTRHPLAENSCSVTMLTKHPSDSILSLHTPGRTRAGARSPLPDWLPDRRGRIPGPRRTGRAEARSRGAAGAERSEFTLDGAAGHVAPRAPRDPSLYAVTRNREEPNKRVGQF